MAPKAVRVLHRLGFAEGAAVVRNNDAISAVICGEFCVLLRENALEHDLHLDGVAQALDRIPVQVRDV
jgi:hypothetical protein